MVGVQGPGMSSGNVKLHDAALCNYDSFVARR